MNKHCGRWVFSKVRGCLMVVAEVARGQGKGGQACGARVGSPARALSPWVRGINTFALSAMVTQTLLAPLSAYAQIRNDSTAPGTQRPTVLNTSNGLPQVNITTPSAAGVSRNRLSQMDVDSRGAVVNNSRTNTPSQIGGWVQGNPWLASGEARVILLEVNSGNPSHINGFIEIAGQRSEIIVANPAGLNVNGSGFINASRATLTTGEVNLGANGQGDVSGYTVRGGKITIGAQGFDASLTDYTGILARAVAINGPLTAKELNIVTGANQIAAGGQDATPAASSGAAPSFSLDVSQLGGMYAGKITLLSTEAGVGVRNAGGIQAGKGGLSLSANGDLVNQGGLASQGSATLDNNGRFDNSGTLNTAGPLNLQSGGAVTNSGQIRSAGALSLQTGANLDNSGQIVASTNVQLTAAGRIDNAGGISAGSDLGLQGAQLSNTGQLNAGRQLSLSSAGRFDNAGQIVVQGSVQLQAPLGIGNTGRIESQNNLTLTTAADVSNSGSLIANGALSLQAGTTVNNSGNLMGDKGVTIRNPALIDNQGNIFSGAQTTLTAVEHIDNRGLIIADGDVQLTSGQRIDNRPGAQIYAAGDLQLQTGQAILNGGLIGAGGNAQLQSQTATGRIDSSTGSVLSAGMSSSGTVPLGTGSLSLQGGSAGTVDLKGLTLAGQRIQAQAGTIDLRGQDLLTQHIDLRAVNGDLLAQGSSLQAVQQLRLDAAGQLRTDGAALGANQIAITAREWRLQGGELLQLGTSANDAAIQVSDHIDASGATVAANASDLTLSSQALQLNGATLTHTGTGALVLRSTGPQTVVADDVLLSTGGSLQLDAAGLQAGRGLISAQTNARLSIVGAMTATEGTIVANESLSLQAGSLRADAANLVGVQGNVTLDIAGALSLREGSVQSQANVTIGAGSLNATQALINGQDIAIDTRGGALLNADGAILAVGNLSLASGALDNQRGVLQAGGNATVSTTGAINNQAGQILSSEALAVSSSGAIDNRSAGGARAVIAAGTALSLTSQGLNNGGGDIKSAGSVGIDAGSGNIDNGQGGLIASSERLTLRGNDLDNRHTANASQGIQARSVGLNVRSLDNRSGYLLAQDQMEITSSGALDNTDGVISSTGTLTIKDPQAATNPAGMTLAITNGTGGAIVANGNTEIEARSLDNSGDVVNAGHSSSGTLEAGSGNLRLALSGPLHNRAGAFVQTAEDLNATVGGVTTNAGSLEAVSQLHLSSASIVNQTGGEVRAGLVDLNANTLSNQGLINGGFTLLQAGSIENANGGRIYGDNIAIAASQLVNRGGGTTNPVIASRGDLDLGVGVLSNEEGALLLSLGDTRVGGGLDSNARATGRAGAFVNRSAEVDIFGNLNINANSVQNIGTSVSHESSSTEHIVEYLPVDAGHPQFGQAFSSTTGQMDWRLEYDDQYRADFLPNDGPGIAANQWLTHEYDRTTTVSGTTGRDPARLSVGGNMTVNAGSTVNSMSSMLIGGNFLLSGGSLQNIDGYRSRTITEAEGTSILSYTERRWYDWEREHRRFFSEPGVREANSQNEYEAIPSDFAVHTNPNHGRSRPQDAQAVSVASRSTAPAASTTATGTTAGPVLGRSGPGVVVRTLPAGVGGSAVSVTGATSASTVNAPAISLPNNALFQLRIGAPAGYLVETDPEFTQQRTWLGSDYMLTALSHDPATQTQRLGDGFYEQKLVREQVAQLTGRRFLGSFTDDEAQYRALLEAGVAFAQAYQLKPGIALSREQMALLTSDIVWLVERTVTLPNGSTQRVLVPQLYALVDPSTPTLSAGLISARGVDIKLSGGLFNSGTLAARENLSINAASITNVLGQMQGNNVDLRASGGITSILGQIAARQNLTMNAGGNMVFMGGGISAGGNARLSAGGDLLLLAYDTGRQVRSHSPRDESGNPTGRGPVWSFENSTYNQTGVNINVGGSLSASAGGNLVAQGTNADVGGSTRLSAGGDMSLTTALSGHVQSYNFFNRYKTSGGLIKVEHSIDQRDTNLTHSGNTWNSGGAMNLSAGGDISLVGAQINAQGYRARAGGNYEERAAYDINERVSSQSTRSSGIGTYLADFHNNITWLTTGGEHGGRTETFRATTNIDSTRTATVTHINAGSGTVTRNVGGDAFIEGSIVRGSVVNPLTAGGRITAAAAVDSRHIENSVSTGTIRWQSTQSTGSIEQTLHMPQIHGTIPAGMSAYQGAGGVSVQLPAGSSVRTAIEQLSQEPGKGYLRDLGNRSDIDWQRVQVLNQSLDFSKSGLTKEATIVVIIVVSFLTYGAASSAGTAAGNTVAVSAGEGVALSGGGTFLTGTGATVSGATGAAVTAGVTSLASTAAVSLINNQGDIGATLKELGSKENLQGLLLTMATAGLTQGILSNIPLDGASTLANVNAKSSIELLLARNAIQGLTSAVLESAVMGTSLEEAIKSNLQSALINTVAAKGANQIGDAQLDSTSKAIAHALLGCAVGAANAGNSSGCAPGAAGAAIGEIVAGLYGDGQGLGDLERQLQADPGNAQLKAQVEQVRHTVTELARLSGAGAALLIGGNATDMTTAMNTAQNAAANNYLNHTELKLRDQAQQACNAGNQSACQTVRSLDQLSADRNATIRQGVTSATEGQAGEVLQSMQTTMQGLSDYRGELQTRLNNTTDPSLRASLQNQINQVDNNMKQVAGLGKDYLAQQYQNTGNALYQSAFVQLSAATSGNDLGDAMASVMGVHLARLPTRPANTSDSAATAAAQTSIDLAAIQRARVEQNARRDDGQQYDHYRDPNSVQRGGDWDWQTHAPNGGAVLGTQQTTTVQQGATLDRYGSRNGGYMSPAGTPYEARALPPGKIADSYEQYSVLKPFTVVQESIAPAFGQPGGGLQMRATIPEVQNRTASINDLIRHGYLKDPIK